LPDEQGQSTHYLNQLEQIRDLNETERKRRLVSLAEKIDPELIEIPDTQD
jgi:hypothetical protein